MKFKECTLEYSQVVRRGVLISTSKVRVLLLQTLCTFKRASFYGRFKFERQEIIQGIKLMANIT